MAVDQKESSVVFDAISIQENYMYGDDIDASFTFEKYEAAVDDSIGVFDVNDTLSDRPFVSKCLSSLEEGPRMRFKVDFLSSDAAAFELRYVTLNKEVLGKSLPFTICEEIECQESLIRMHEGVSFDDSLVLIDKISPKSPAPVEAPVCSVDDIVLETKESVERESLDGCVQRLDKSVSCSFALEEETRRRETAEKKVGELARTLSEMMYLTERQGKELTKAEIQRDRQETMKDMACEDLDILEEGIEMQEHKHEMIQKAAEEMQNEYFILKKKLKEEEHLVHQLKMQILDDRQEHKEEMDEITQQRQEMLETLKEALHLERKRNAHLASELENLKEEIEFEFNEKNEELKETQVNLEKVTKDLEKEHEESGLKLQEQTKTHEEIIDRLENELKKEVENKTLISREYEKTIRDLESRVVNESTNASRTENDLAVAENRYKEATEDIKYFRQKFLETEQRLQVNQMHLSKALDEVNNFRSMDVMSSISDTTVDDKSTVCESSCVSASTSIENFTHDRRRRPGDITDFTDDESNSWYHSSIRSQSLESIPVGQSANTANTFHQPGRVAGLIQIKKRNPTSDGNTEQQISVVDSRRPSRRNRRKYSKPIDLTPSSSLTTVAINDRSVVNQQAMQHYHNQQHMMQFNRNIVEIDRPTLEKQYVAIRQHRNSLIRESNFLNNKCNGLKQELLFTQKNFQNFSLEAEHKIAMLLMALHNQECVATQDINSLIQMFPVPCNQQHIYAQYPQQNIEEANTCGYLSPYAPEYKPNNQPMYNQMPPGPPIYIQNDGVQQYIDYGQQQDEGGYLMAVPSQLPETPIPQDDVVIDASEQLATIGVQVSTDY